MAEKLFVTDLDWTLLNGSVLTHESHQGLRDILEEKRVCFTIASARSIKTIFEIIPRLNFELPVIQLNGAAITNLTSNEDIYFASLLNKDFQNLTAIFKDFNACYLVTGMENNSQVCYIPKHRNKKMEFFYQDRVSRKDERVKEVDKSIHLDILVLSVTLIEQHERSTVIHQTVQKELGENFQIYPMGRDGEGWEWTTYQAINATKGDALKYLVRQCGFSMKDTTSFGDNINDVTMIENSGTGIAVENAIDILKDKADKIIGPCNENSVVNYIRSQK